MSRRKPFAPTLAQQLSAAYTAYRQSIGNYHSAKKGADSARAAGVIDDTYKELVRLAAKAGLPTMPPPPEARWQGDWTDWGPWLTSVERWWVEAEARRAVADAAPPSLLADGNRLEITPGGIKYGEAAVDLSGKPLACIRELLDAQDHRLDWRKLQDRVWGQDTYTERGTIKNTIADARDALRKLARCAGKRIGKDFNPLPCVDRGKDLAWKLNFPE